MAQQFLVRAEILDELEEHLRDDVDEQTRSGRPLDEAVEAAMIRLGDPRALAAEFAKIPTCCEPWLPVRLAIVGGTALAASMVMPLWPKLSAGGLTSLLAGHMGAVMLGYVATLLVGFLAASFLVARLFRGPSEGQTRTLRLSVIVLSSVSVGLTGVGMAVGCLFCPNEKTGWAYGLDTREIGGIAILVWDAAMLAAFWAFHRAQKLQNLMLLGVVGNVMVLLGWLGASAVDRQLHGVPADYSPVAVLVLSQLAIGLLALAPAGSLRSKHMV